MNFNFVFFLHLFFCSQQLPGQRAISLPNSSRTRLFFYSSVSPADFFSFLSASAQLNFLLQLKTCNVRSRSRLWRLCDDFPYSKRLPTKESRPARLSLTLSLSFEPAQLRAFLSSSLCSSISFRLSPSARSPPLTPFLQPFFLSSARGTNREIIFAFFIPCWLFGVFLFF